MTGSPSSRRRLPLQQHWENDVNMLACTPGRGELWRHAKVARALGSPFVAAVLEAGERQLARAPRTAALIRNWPGDSRQDAVAMRFNAALHALARHGRLPALSALYANQHDDFDGAIGAAMVEQDDVIALSMRDTPQTNEVGRSAAIAAALMVARQQFGLPFELLEIGSSCGLNLNLGYHEYELGGVSAGAIGSSVKIAPTWSGGNPPRAPIDVITARGTDLNPLNASDPQVRDRLMSYVWADQPHRARRLESALALALRHPPQIDRADAVTWLSQRLEDAQAAGQCRVIFHSMVLQYLTEHDRQTITSMIRHAGARATADKPLAWISFEWTALRDEVQLCLTCWPGGETRVLATCHPYGEWIDWRR